MAGKRHEELQSLRVWPDDHLRLGLRLRRTGRRVATRVSWREPVRGQLLPRWRRKSEWLSRGKRQRVRGGIERELAGKCHRRNDGWRREEVHGARVSVVT